MRYQTGNFSLEVPDDWQDRSIISFTASVSPNEFAPNVVVTREAIDTRLSIEEYANRQFDLTQAEVQGLQITERRQTTIGTIPAVQIVQQIAAHGLNLQQLQTFLLVDEVVIIVTCTSTAATFNQNLPRFTKIVESCHLVNP